MYEQVEYVPFGNAVQHKTCPPKWNLEALVLNLHFTNVYLVTSKLSPVSSYREFFPRLHFASCQTFISGNSRY
jgi:hypothetical protein